MPGEAVSNAYTMMLAFRSENVRSFRDPLELSLEATPTSEKGVRRYIPWRQGGGHPIAVLPAAGIFGANASGKTNILRAVDDMRRLILTSFRSGDRSSRIARQPFLLDPEYKDTPSSYEIDVILDGIRYEYGFTLDDTHVISEFARRYPRGKAATIFRRKGLDVHVGEDHRAKGRAVSEILRPNSLYLSAAAAADHPGLQSLYKWFDSNLRLCEASSRASRWAYTTDVLSRKNLRSKALAMLHAADLGITDAKLREPDPEFTERFKRIMKIVQREMDFDEALTAIDDPDFSFLGVALSHRGKNGSVEFDSQDESLGTLVWLGLIGPVLDALANGTLLLVDELESSLHPSLVAQLVRTFQNVHSNPNGAQLIFNSFEASLMGNSVEDRILSRDQVWFTEKLHDGSTRLYPLTDLNPRKAEAVGRRYLAGRYGATPIINEAEFDALAAMVVSETAR